MACPSTSLHCICSCLASLTPAQVGLGLTQVTAVLDSPGAALPCRHILILAQRHREVSAVVNSVTFGAGEKCVALSPGFSSTHIPKGAVPPGARIAACWVMGAENLLMFGMRLPQAEPVSAQPLPPKICCTPQKFLHKGFQPEVPSPLRT